MDSTASDLSQYYCPGTGKNSFAFNCQTEVQVDNSYNIPKVMVLLSDS